MIKSVKVLRSFALPFQGIFIEGREIKLMIVKSNARGVVTEDRYEELVKNGHIEELMQEEAIEEANDG